MNLLLLILVCASAYFLTEIFEYFSRCYDQYQLKRFYSSELNRHKARKVMQIAKRFYIEHGYNEAEAEEQTIIYIDSVTRNGQLDEKYKLTKGA